MIKAGYGELLGGDGIVSDWVPKDEKLRTIRGITRLMKF